MHMQTWTRCDPTLSLILSRGYKPYLLHRAGSWEVPNDFDFFPARSADLAILLGYRIGRDTDGAAHGQERAHAEPCVGAAAAPRQFRVESGAEKTGEVS